MEYLKYPLFSFTTYFDLEEIIFENNIISVELAKVLRYDKLVLNLSFVTLCTWIMLEYPLKKRISKINSHDKMP
jgi:hypothetical protein